MIDKGHKKIVQDKGKESDGRSGGRGRLLWGGYRKQGHKWSREWATWISNEFHQKLLSSLWVMELHSRLSIGFPWWLSGKESACQCREHEFDPWSGKIPHAMEQWSLWITTTQAVLQSLGTATTEACMPWSPSCAKQKSPQWEVRTQLERSPRSSQSEKSPCSNEDTAQPKI